MHSASSVTSTFRLPRVLVALVAAAVALVVVATPALADVSFINAKRSGAGLAPVSSHSGLASLARSHSAAMAERGSLYHGGNLAGRVATVVPNWQGVGENVGVGASLADVNAMFMNSATHRANILGNFNLAGVGVVQGADGRVWVTQIFARASGQTTTTVQATAPRTSTSTATATRTTTAPRQTTVRASRSGARTPVVAPEPPKAVSGLSTPGGYRVLSEDGDVRTHGQAESVGSAAELGLNEKIVGGASSPSGKGYALFGDKGGVFTFGDAGFHGSAADLALHAPIVGGAITPTGGGYTLFSADGGALAYGDATYAGSTVGTPLNGSVVGGARTASGRGYWLAGSDGGVYAFGDAVFHGSAAELGQLAAPIVAMSSTPTGKGYWLVAADGGVFAFGDAEFHGSAHGQPLPAPIRGLIPAPGGHGYWLLRADREVIPFGTVESSGRRIVGIAGLRNQ